MSSYYEVSSILEIQGLNHLKWPFNFSRSIQQSNYSPTYMNFENFEIFNHRNITVLNVCSQTVMRELVHWLIEPQKINDRTSNRTSVFHSKTIFDPHEGQTVVTFHLDNRSSQMIKGVEITVTKVLQNQLITNKEFMNVQVVHGMLVILIIKNPEFWVF